MTSALSTTLARRTLSSIRGRCALLLIAFAVGIALFIGFDASPASATPAPPSDFTCSSYENRVRWSDADQSKYWVYRSLDGGLTWNWLGRTLGETTFIDTKPDIGVRYQVHYAGLARQDCDVLKPVGFECASFGGRVAWSDAGRSKYWVYRSLDDGLTWNWVGRTLGETTFVDLNPTGNATYQAHYAGIARQACAPGPTFGPSLGPFSCTVDGDTVSWPDAGQSKYWVYRSLDGGLTWSWLGRTLGETTFRDPNPTDNATYQAHYAGIARRTCSDASDSPTIGRVLLEGESTAARSEFTAEVARHITPADLVNDGNNGDQITRLNSEAAVQPANVAGQPDVAVLWIGINDLSANRQAVDIYADMAQWVTDRRADGWDRIVLLTVTRFENPPGARGGRPIEVIDQRRSELNNLIVANGMGVDAVVDLRSIAGIGDAFSVFDPYWRTDGVHFTGSNAPGDAYVVIGELVGRTIAGLTP